MKKTVKKGHILNSLVGIIIIFLLIYNITTEGNWISGTVSLILFVVSYILERNKVTIYAWVPITFIALIWSMSPFFGNWFFGA